MTLVAFLGSATTVVSFLAFVAIVAWAYGKRRHARFDAAAQAPFALPDEVSAAPAQRTAESRS